MQDESHTGTTQRRRESYLIQSRERERERESRVARQELGALLGYTKSMFDFLFFFFLNA